MRIYNFGKADGSGALDYVHKIQANCLERTEVSDWRN